MNPDALLWFFMSMWLATQLGKVIKGAWRDDTGRPWYEPYLRRGQHRQADKDKRYRKTWKAVNEHGISRFRTIRIRVPRHGWFGGLLGRMAWRYPEWVIAIGHHD